MQSGVAPIELRSLDCHRAVEVDLPAPEAEVAVVSRQLVQNVLHASDGDRRNADDAYGNRAIGRSPIAEQAECVSPPALDLAAGGSRARVDRAGGHGRKLPVDLNASRL